MAGEQLEPITRKEYFLAKAAGMDVETPEPITREEMFLSMISGGGTGGSGGADWNASEGEPGYVKNRTHYEETAVVNEPIVISWDGNTEGLTNPNGSVLYKVSDLILSNDQLNTTTITLNDGTEYIVGAMLDQCYITEDIAMIGEFAAFVRKSDVTAFGMTFPESGLYFVYFDGFYTSSLSTTEPIEHTKTIVHTIDKKYLPAGIGSGGVFVANIVYSDPGYTTNVTSEELNKAYEGGKTLYANINNGIIYPLSAIYIARENTRFTFSGVNMYAGRVPYYEAFTIKDSTVTVNDFTLTEAT